MLQWPDAQFKGTGEASNNIYTYYTMVRECRARGSRGEETRQLFYNTTGCRTRSPVPYSEDKNMVDVPVGCCDSSLVIMDALTKQ